MFRTVIGGMALTLLLAGLGLALAAEDRDRDTALTDKEFVNQAASGGMFEVQSSKLALDRVKHDKLKKFAQQMVEDHTKANKELERLAKDAGFEVPRRMNEKHQKMMDKLRDAGDRFDMAYTETQVKAHAEAVTLFAAQAKNGKNADLRKWAEKTLPTLREHKEMINTIAGSLEKGKRDR